MNKKLKSLVSTIVLLAIIILIAYLFKSEKNNSEHAIVSHTMIVQQIEEMGKLEVVKYNIQDIMEYKKVRKWLPNSTVSLKIVGEVIACVDLTLINEKSIVTNGDSVSLVLPIPEICHHKIDHSQSRVYNVEYGLWEATEIVDDAYRNAEEHIYQQAQNMGIENESRENAIKALTPILRGMGFTKIHIGFETSSAHTDSERQLKIEQK